jgi:hypothetical protein
MFLLAWSPHGVSFLLEWAIRSTVTMSDTGSSPLKSLEEHATVRGATIGDVGTRGRGRTSCSSIMSASLRSASCARCSASISAVRFASCALISAPAARVAFSVCCVVCSSSCTRPTSARSWLRSPPSRVTSACVGGAQPSAARGISAAGVSPWNPNSSACARSFKLVRGHATHRRRRRRRRHHDLPMRGRRGAAPGATRAAARRSRAAA